MKSTQNLIRSSVIFSLLIFAGSINVKAQSEVDSLKKVIETLTAKDLMVAEHLKTSQSGKGRLAEY